LGGCCCCSPSARLLVSSVGSSSIPAVLRGAKKLHVGSSSCDGICMSLAPVVCLAAFFVCLACSPEELRFHRLRLCSLKCSSLLS
jgi:hypothetical protein